MNTTRHQVFHDGDVVGFPEKSSNVLYMLSVAPKFEIFSSASTSRHMRKVVRMRTTRRLGNMVAVMANEQQQFESLVTQLMSPDNNIRNQAEVGKSLFFSVESFHCFTCPRNYIGAFAGKISLRSANRRLHSIDSSCHVHLRVWWTFSRPWNSCRFLKTVLLLASLTVLLLSKERVVLMIFLPTFSLLSFENFLCITHRVCEFTENEFFRD